VIWALKDVSFEVKQGEVVGIIGRNGAGKSTLLKILSQITEPTCGYAEIRGRVGSLLEVGTGFHPDLTGRENTYLNGTIMGMKKREIDRRFDEIVAFAEVEKFIDTPVKFYSSGMYTRLAFAVAAHLQPEILIVDEVLAVGDATFQKKCLGKMGDVATKEGRTVLFVSHNMAAVRALCSRALLMKGGQLAMDAVPETVTSEYLSEDDTAKAKIVWNQHNAPKSSEVCFIKAYILNDKGEYASLLDCRKQFFIVVEYEVLEVVKGLRIGILIQNNEGIIICGSNTVLSSSDKPNAWLQPLINPGFYKTQCTFPGYIINAGRYSVCFGSDRLPDTIPLLLTPYCLSFAVEDLEGHPPLNEKLPGILRPKLDWQITPLNL
jgi:lipopolysaccharide transport system ATP-binding protein